MIQLLDQPETETEAEAEAGAGLEVDDQDEVETEAEPEQSAFHNIAEPSEVAQPDVIPVAEVMPPVSRTPSDLAMANGHNDERLTTANMALNFLQEDELAEPNIEDSYEVVPMLEPHQVCQVFRRPVITLMLPRHQVCNLHLRILKCL